MKGLTLFAYLSAAILVFIILPEIIKVFFADYMLGCYKNIAEMYFNNLYIYESGLGYVSQDRTHIIGYECLGVNFIVLLVLIFFKSIPKLQGANKLYWFLLSLPLSFLIGFAANTLRLLGSIHFVSSLHFRLIHQVLGILVYLFFLMLAQLVIINKALRFLYYTDVHKEY